MSAADRALADKAKASGTAFQSREDATRSFQNKYAQTYTSRYTSEPTVRPTHIPPTYVVHNHTYNIVYDRGYGGYGYYDSGRWFYYDAFADAVELALLMERNNYYYNGYVRQPQVVVVQQPPPVVVQQPAPVVVQQQPPVVVQQPDGTVVAQQPQPTVVAQQPAPVVVQQPPAVVVQQQPSSGGWGYLLLGIAIGVVVLIVIGVIVARE